MVKQTQAILIQNESIVCMLKTDGHILVSQCSMICEGYMPEVDTNYNENWLHHHQPSFAVND
jgi:hypothetical protein